MIVQSAPPQVPAGVLFTELKNGRTMASAPKGFTLIELMIVVAIIGTLAAIALPVYINNIAKSANSACLGEAKGFITDLIVALNDGASLPAFSQDQYASCRRINITADNKYVTAYPVEPGNTGISCDLDSSSTCKFDPTVLENP